MSGNSGDILKKYDDMTLLCHGYCDNSAMEY